MCVNCVCVFAQYELPGVAVATHLHTHSLVTVAVAVVVDDGVN